VAQSDEISGLGLRTDRPKLNTAIDLASLKLTPTEGYVLSRIDGRVSYDEICRISMLGREGTLTILRKLKKAAIILGPKDTVVSPPPVRKSARKSPSPDRGHTIGHTTHRTPAPVQVTPEMLRKAQEKAGDKPEPAGKEPGSLLERLDNDDPVAPADLIEGHDLSSETKRRIIRVYRRLRKLPAHELLGVPEAADKATLKRAFAAASKELHPDRYYGKDLGPFREKLAKIFARLTEAVQELEKAHKGK